MNELLVVLTGATPVGEVRAAIPIAIAVFGFAPLKAYLLGVLGNILPILPLLLILNYASERLMHRFYFFNRFFNWLFKYTRERHSKHFDRYLHKHPEGEEHGGWGFWGAFALFVFVAIPVPFTGVWSGCLAAFIFGIPIRKAFPAIALGAAAAGLIVLAVMLGLIGGLDFLRKS